MGTLQTYQVFPALPKPIAFLETLGRNLWWSWRLDAIELFRRINPRLWDQSGRNPILFLSSISQDRFQELAEDNGFLAHVHRVQNRFETENQIVSSSDGFYEKNECIAYFSMEFGLHESVPLYAGGLGVLAGDHLKAASDNHLPLVAVGLLYRHGYFHQFLGPDGWQQEDYPETDLYHLPLERSKDASGNGLKIVIPGPKGDIQAKVWKIQVGRVPLFLLDTYLPENRPEIREITSRLYVAEGSVRLGQEILLGIGGMKALSALGFSPNVVHMNEGHCAFANLERIPQTMERHGIDLKTAKEIVARTTVFTTHTPVAAGHDEFPPDLVKPYLHEFKNRLGVSAEELLSWGQPQPDQPESPLSMFVLGLRMSQHCNGVSELHGRVARRMWADVWPTRPEDEIPIDHITNGIHIPSWLSIENALLFERYLGPEWFLNTWDSGVSEHIDDIYDEELWRAREMSRSRLIRSSRALMLRQYRKRNAPKSVLEAAESVLDQDVLTIGFARRFATYKRAELLLKESERLESLINSEKTPIQLIFAGKAHPKDNEGKAIIKQIIQFAQKASVRHRVVFLEDYDMNIGRRIVQGVDVWLNTPRRPHEACGTSGMKAAINGALNVSTLDGWWNEGYEESRGWKIGSGEEYADWAYQDFIDSQALYNILENDVIPAFYERKNGDAPGLWIKMMKSSMKMVMESFCAQWMVNNYEKKFYRPATKRNRELLSDNAAEAKALAEQKNRLQNLWKSIRIEPPVRMKRGPFRVGESFSVTVTVHLGELSPQEVKVELYSGKVRSIDSLFSSIAQEMHVEEPLGNGSYRYVSPVSCETSGRYGFTVRVTPQGDAYLQTTPGLISWAE